MSNILKKTKSGYNRDEVLLSLSEGTEKGCSCGINCKHGFLALPNYNSASGDIINYMAAYFVDGVLTQKESKAATAEICGYKSNSLFSAVSVTISGCISGTLAVAATRQLTASVSPSNSLQTGTWTTSAAGVATVSLTGLVTGVSAGTATITFTSTDGAKTANCAVTVV
jgi:uncharacterized protein YjdB